MMLSNGGLQGGGYISYLVNLKSTCECCMVFRDLLFVSNTSYAYIWGQN